MKRTFTKKDLENAFHAGSRKRFDTGIPLYNSFKDYYKLVTKKTKS